MYRYGLIGNCQASALIHETGSIHWFCAPRPDSPPVFGKLLDPDGGEFSVTLVDAKEFSQQYLPNTNILLTKIKSATAEISITDFCPRFEQFGRKYRPVSLFRIVETISGSPSLLVKCNPVAGWEKNPVRAGRGNSHVRYEMRDEVLRLTTNMPLTHLIDETSFQMTEPIYLALTWSGGVEEDLARISNDFLWRTNQYWQNWVKHCGIPTQFQKETIRSALALKLHCYEDTGAILAAMTTSLPEEFGGTRNWDYRLCWPRDSYFTLSAFHRLGHFEEMEGFLKFMLGVVHSYDRVRPVYRIDGTLPLPELEHKAWAGFSNSRPVRSNNQAAEHIQNDVFGEIILTLAPIFFDERFHHLRSAEHERLLEHLALLSMQSISRPDAGLWEIRGQGQEHSFTNLMCWAGLDRVVQMQQRGYLKKLSFDAAAARDKAAQATRAAAKEMILYNGPSDSSFNAALLEAPLLRFPDSDLAEKTLDATYEALRLSKEGDGRFFLYRYRSADDFGTPQSAFVICSFWWIQALAKAGRVPEAREAMQKVLTSANPVGLLSEHFDPATWTQLGNFPQAYSHVGEINAAFAVSPPWDEVL